MHLQWDLKSNQRHTVGGIVNSYGKVFISSNVEHSYILWFGILLSVICTHVY